MSDEWSPEEFIEQLSAALDAARAGLSVKTLLRPLRYRCIELDKRLKTRDEKLEQTLKALTDTNDRLAQELRLSE